MKTTKRFLAILVAVMMVAAMLTIPAGAVNDPTVYTITINNAAQGHTYEAYQIFDGDLDGETLSNITWGTGVNGAEATAGIGAASLAATTLTTEDHAKAFALAIAPYLASTPTATATYADGKYTISNLDAGYYLVKDQDDSQNDGSDYTRYIIAVVNNVSVTNKSALPSISKAVKGFDDADFAEAISACIGETVSYRVTVTMHGYVNDFDHYYFRVEDTLPEGITYKELTSVQYVNGSTVKDLQTSDYVVEHDGQKVIFTVKDALEALEHASGTDVLATDSIVLTYTATVNEKVVIGEVGNKNTAVLYYANNPNDKTYDPKAATLAAPTNLGKMEENAFVYAYQLDLLKLDATDATLKLEGAQFVLSRFVDGTTREYAIVKDGKLVGFTTDASKKTTLTTDEFGKIVVSGLASNTYRLQETVAPGGYNLPTSEVTVTITGSLNKQTGVLSGLSASTVGGVSATATMSTGVVDLTVVNHRGAILPSTGGMGTTIFYVIGGILMIGAAAVLVTKKRGARG